MFRGVHSVSWGCWDSCCQVCQAAAPLPSLLPRASFLALLRQLLVFSGCSGFHTSGACKKPIELSVLLFWPDMKCSRTAARDREHSPGSLLSPKMFLDIAFKNQKSNSTWEHFTELTPKTGCCRGEAEFSLTFTVPSTSTNQRLSMAWICPSVSSGLAAWIFFLTTSSRRRRLSLQ